MVFTRNRRSCVLPGKGRSKVDRKPIDVITTSRDVSESAAANAGGRRRVLIVVSSYAPTMIADMHRARHLAWELPKLGWDVEILAPDSSYQLAACLDADSDAFFPDDTALTFVPAFAPGLFKSLGVGSIGWRAVFPLWRAGRRLLKRRRFDVVYVSTTQFPLFLLGRWWRREFGTPYVLDIHDPVYKEPARYRAWLRPELKHVLANRMAKYIESYAARSAAGIVSVSPGYIEDLRRRHGKAAWSKPGLTQVIPFAVLPHDLQAVGKGQENRSTPFNGSRIVYVGAGGAIMRRAFSLLCRALAYLREQRNYSFDGMAFELYGTLRGWREGGPKELADIAIEYGVGDLVDERPTWVSYRRSLELLRDSDGALMLGVDDASYMPSKLFSYAYSGKPLLALLRKEGPAFAEFQRSALGHALWFSETETMPIAQAAALLQEFLVEVERKQRFDRAAATQPFLARTMAARHAELFAAVRASEAAGKR